ncbi:hypothetical protein [Kaistella sp.]|uniref:hypothetical protein n=1 Tax=Kaistella sp. TaxID=2782235 RepID=UPI003C62E751
MKKFYILLLLSSFYLFKAQEIKEIFIAQNGNKAIVNLYFEGTTLSLDTYGNLLQMNMPSESNVLLNQSTAATFQNDVELNYRDPNTTISKESHFQYYNDFYSYNSGKLKSVYGIPFKYYDDFYVYQTGKLNSVGDLKFKYYDDFYKYQKGKIKSIGNITFTYHDDFYKYKTGKLKSIKGNTSNIKITVFND